MNRSAFFHGREISFLGKTTSGTREDFKIEVFTISTVCNISVFSLVKITAEAVLQNNRSQNDYSSRNNK